MNTPDDFTGNPSATPTITTVRLRNGAEEAAPLISVVMLALSDLFVTDPIVAYELVMLARDSKHKLWSNQVAERLKRLVLIEGDGRMHDSVRNIVTSAVTGDGLNMTLKDPRDLTTARS